MNRIAKFEKVSFEQFKRDVFDEFGEICTEEALKDMYDKIKLPKRATSGSAGYDFYLPFTTLNLSHNTFIKIPTGIRCKMDEGWVLKAYPRSGHGFKTGVHLANTVGIIDADYYNADNEGHINIKLVNDSLIGKLIELKQGEAFCQAIFVPFGITVDDNADGVRTGGFGSTDNK